MALCNFHAVNVSTIETDTSIPHSYCRPNQIYTNHLKRLIRNKQTKLLVHWISWNLIENLLMLTRFRSKLLASSAISQMPLLPTYRSYTALSPIVTTFTCVRFCVLFRVFFSFSSYFHLSKWNGGSVIITSSTQSIQDIARKLNFDFGISIGSLDSSMSSKCTYLISMIATTTKEPFQHITFSFAFYTHQSHRYVYSINMCITFFNKLQ